MFSSRALAQRSAPQMERAIRANEETFRPVPQFHNLTEAETAAVAAT